EPGYGETPLEPEEAHALTPQAREIFGDEPKKIELYEAEQAINDEVSIALLDDIADGRLALTDILTDAFLRDLHQKLCGDLWMWAGRYRTRDVNIGVAPERIADRSTTSGTGGSTPTTGQRGRSASPCIPLCPDGPGGSQLFSVRLQVPQQLLP
ncbi:MAG: hypothetical protein QM622_05865, partial [Microbacterium sp.]